MGKKFAFYVSNNASLLKKIISFAKENNISIFNNVVFVFIDNDNNTELKKLAQKYKIKLIEKNFSNIEKKHLNLNISDMIKSLLDKYQIDYLFILCKTILTGELLSYYENRIINTHPSILPSFKGLNAIDQAKDSKSFLLGLTIHTIDEKLDEGVPILQTIKHHSYFYGNYDYILDDCIIAILQIMIWINEARLIINNGYSHILDASYTSGLFIPNIDDPVLKRVVEKNTDSNNVAIESTQ